MAWDVLPESYSAVTEAADALAMDATREKDLHHLWEFLREKYPDEPAPIALGSKGTANDSKKKVKVVRYISEDYGVDSKGADLLKKAAKLKLLNISWGDGSRNGKGSKNQGAGFEKDLNKQINLWIEGGLEECTDDLIKEFIMQMTAVGTQEWFGNKKMTCAVMGDKDTKRPLALVAGSWHVGGAGSGIGFNIGEKISDVTVSGEKLGNVYISAKTSGTTNLINCGVKTDYFKPQDIKDKNINTKGKALLKTFGINAEEFCDFFNNLHDIAEAALPKKVDKWPSGRQVKASASDFDTALLSSLIKGSLGHGFWYVHKQGQKIFHQWMTEKFLKESCIPDVSNITLEFGGGEEGAKRINILMETAHLELQFNIRNTSSEPSPGDPHRVYPTHLQAGYKFKKETKATWFHEASGKGANTKRDSNKANKLIKGKKNIVEAPG